MIRKLLQREIQREIRSGGYTDLLVAGLETTVAGADATALVTGALETCAGLWARALAAAKVEGTDALTGRVRHRIGRDLVRVGESVHEIRTDGGRAMLEPASHWEVLEGWRYRLDFQVPPGKLVQRTVPRGRVAHFMWAENPREPWRGLAPLTAASKLSTLIARVEDRLAQDLNTPVAHLVPIPSDGGDSKLDNLRTDIGDAKGAAVLVESTQVWDEADHRSPRHDWRSERLGPEVPDGLVNAFEAIQCAVADTCGIPADLVSKDVDGTAQRESYRRWIMSSVEPVASLIAETAGEALETDVSFDFRGLWAHDLAGRAGAFQRLTGGGVSTADALEAVGLG